MSMENLEKALELAEQCLYYEFCGEKTDETIGKAEHLLGFNLSEQMKLYLTQYGYISFFGNEFYGILKDDFSGGYTGNCVESALIDRKELNLPLKWLPIHELGDGYMAYQNYDVINEDHEPPKIRFPEHFKAVEQ